MKSIFYYFILLFFGWIISNECACTEEERKQIKSMKSLEDRLLLDLFGRACLKLNKNPLLKFLILSGIIWGFNFLGILIGQRLF